MSKAENDKFAVGLRGRNAYKDAAGTTNMESNCEPAIELFTELGNYKDSAEQILEMQEALYGKVECRRAIEGTRETEVGM